MTYVLTPGKFQNKVLNWFDQHGRHDLPWQSDRSPYRVWLSEIMLQQTQVTTVIPYFERFVAAFPTVHALAAADEDAVLHLWTGLGYYARARNLLKCAQQVCDQFAGEFPNSVELLSELPGIGRSTAGAIVSIAFQQPAAILDGNVKRVLARYAAVPGWPGKTAVHKELWEVAERYSPQQRCADYTQAMMDLGATLCTRSKPDCAHCPLHASCKGFATGTQADYPGRKPRTVLPVKNTHMLIICNPAGEVFLARRPSEGLWGGLWSLPEVNSEADATTLCIDTFGCAPSTLQSLPLLRHTFSHFHLDIQPWQLELPGTPTGIMEGEPQVWYNRTRPEALGMAAPVVKLLKLLDNLE